MRITLITVGSRGDIQPFVPLALGLQAAGHQVRIATHGPYEDFVRFHHLDFHPIVGNPQEILQTESGLAWLETGQNPVTFLRRMRDIAHEILEQLGRDCLNASQDADMILFSTLGFFTGVPIAEKLGVPGIATYLQPIQRTRTLAAVVIPELPGDLPLKGQYNRLTHDLMMEMIWRLFGQAYNHLRTGILGLPPEKRSFRVSINDPYPVIYGFSPHVIPPPPDWGEHICISGYWFLDDPEWQPEPELLDFLAAGPAPVYIGFGSMANRNVDQLTDTVLDAVARTGQRAILLSGWAGMGSRDLPDTIYKLDYAPHGWLFPRMVAVVHHGGAGTTAAGLRAGVPAVVIPHFADQPFWGRRVAALGVGPQPIPRKQLTAAKLTAAIDMAVSSPAMRQHAAELGAKIRAEDGVANAVRCIDAVIRRQSSTSDSSGTSTPY
ncbi:MAG TPA: glycosyltransferase [Spirillospora sp.]|nr:glycosyltransferase [Spirillospora sp.]